VCGLQKAAKFQFGFPVQIKDNSNSEWNTVASVNGNVLTMQNNLAYTYHAANAGVVEALERARWNYLVKNATQPNIGERALSMASFEGALSIEGVSVVLARLLLVVHLFLSGPCRVFPL